MLSEKNAKLALKILIPMLIAALSVCVLSVKIPETSFFTGTIESLDESKSTVLTFAGATMATSVAISALPDDLASPLANSLADMEKYYIFLMVCIMVERLIVVEGTKIAFVFMIPIACGLALAASLSGKEWIKIFAIKFMILSLSLVLVIPCSTHFTNIVCADYLSDISETVEEINITVDETNSMAISSATEKVNNLLNEMNRIVKDAMASIAKLIVTNFVIPLVTLFLFKWLLQLLFNVNLPIGRAGR